MRMNGEEFERERGYQTLMVFVRGMLRRGLISEEEYCQIDTMEKAKYKPVTGDLLSGKSLICAGFRANMTAGKEADDA